MICHVCTSTSIVRGLYSTKRSSLSESDLLLNQHGDVWRSYMNWCDFIVWMHSMSKTVHFYFDIEERIVASRRRIGMFYFIHFDISSFSSKWVWGFYISSDCRPTSMALSRVHLSSYQWFSSAFLRIDQDFRVQDCHYVWNALYICESKIIVLASKISPTLPES